MVKVKVAVVFPAALVDVTMYVLLSLTLRDEIDILVAVSWTIEDVVNGLPSFVQENIVAGNPSINSKYWCKLV